MSEGRTLKPLERRGWRRREGKGGGSVPGTLGLLLLLATFAFALLYAAPRWIEADVQRSVEATLAEQGHAEVEVSVDGQSVRLQGQTDPETGRKLEGLAKATAGTTWIGALTAPIEVKGTFVAASGSTSTATAPSEAPPKVGEPADGKDPALVAAAAATTSSHDGDGGSNVEGASHDGDGSSKVEGASHDGDGSSKVEGGGLAPSIPAAVQKELDRCEGELQRVLSESKIRFGVNSAALRGSSRPVLRKVAAILKDCPGRVQVEGHSDSSGVAPQNLRLSQRRADAVLKALTRLGIERTRLTAKGFGPSRPLVPEKTKKDREINRRIEFHLLPSED